MNMIIQPALRPTQRPRVIALHCSGANADQWRNLTEVLSGEFDVLAPEHFGSERRGPWPGEHGLSLADEAARTIAMIDESAHETHVVGHSYGGGVALNVALSRPCRIASMVLRAVDLSPATADGRARGRGPRRNRQLSPASKSGRGDW
jgi:pimeloyl-ACP methyl ester carboxylesterase